MRTDCGASQSEVQPRTESSSTKLDTLLLLLWGSAGTASIDRKQVFVHLDLTLFRPQHLLRSLGFLQLSSFLLRRSVGFSLTINMKLTSYKNGEDRWGPAVALAALQLLFLFPGSFLTTFPLCPHHTCSGLQLFLRIWIIHLKVSPFPPQLHALLHASTDASVFSDVYYFLNIYHLFHKSLRRNGEVCSWSAILNQKPPTPIAFFRDQLSQIFSELIVSFNLFSETIRDF